MRLDAPFLIPLTKHRVSRGIGLASCPLSLLLRNRDQHLFIDSLVAMCFLYHPPECPSSSLGRFGQPGRESGPSVRLAHARTAPTVCYNTHGATIWSVRARPASAGAQRTEGARK